MPDFNASQIPLDDGPTYAMLAQGETMGVFQLESAGMRDAVRAMRADRFEDLIALVALYRPGPMANIPSYCARKLGKEPVEYLHPVLEPILKETFGIITYQEQVQQTARDMAGYTLAQADLLRRAMGKKIKSEMDAQREVFHQRVPWPTRRDRMNWPMRCLMPAPNSPSMDSTNPIPRHMLTSVIKPPT